MRTLPALKSSILAFSICLATALPAAADSVSCEIAEWKTAFAAGQKAEKSGNTLNAVLYYRHAAYCIPDARAAYVALTRRLASEAEKAGRTGYAVQVILHNTDSRCRAAFDSGKVLDPPGICSGDRRAAINPEAGAIAWYEEGGHYADADRVRIAAVRQNPGDAGLFRSVKETLERHAAEPPEGYPKPSPWLDELKRIASERGTAAFSREPDEFARKEVDLMGGGSPGQRSLRRLTEARQWWEFFSDPRLKECRARAEARADALAADPSNPNSIADAILLYELFGNPAKTAAARANAKRLGDAAAKKGDRMTAAQYYAVAGDQAAAQKISKELADDAVKAAKEGRGTPAPKDEQKQKKFRQETEDLEKELGL